MDQAHETKSRHLLANLRKAMASEDTGQARLDHITRIIASGMECEVCSIYLFRDEQTLELCATTGLRADAVHKTRLRNGEGLVGRVARRGFIINTANAPKTPGFRYMPETEEEAFLAFLGVPIKRLGKDLGVLVVQSQEERMFTSPEIHAIEIVAMVLAEMAELGVFVGDSEPLTKPHTRPQMFSGTSAQEGAAHGKVWLHEPRVVITNPIAEEPTKERARLKKAIDALRISVDEMLSHADTINREQYAVLQAYRMFANSQGWYNRMCSSIAGGLSAEAAVEREQTNARIKLMKSPDPNLRERLHDLNDLSNRLLRILTGQGKKTGATIPENPVLIARNIGPAELMDYGRKLHGIVLEEGSIGSHATIIARAWGIPLIINTAQIIDEALNGDDIIVDGMQGLVHLRPDENVVSAFNDKIAMHAEAQKRFHSIRTLPAESQCGKKIKLYMNSGLIADLPSLQSSGADGVGLFRTELQFLVQSAMPKREELVQSYSRVMHAAGDKPIIFRTLDIGSDKILPYMRKVDEPNPALGWRALRVGLDKKGIMKMQVQALIRAAAGKTLRIMFPLVSHYDEFKAARAEIMRTLQGEKKLGHKVSNALKIGAMLETPSLAFAPDAFFEEVDFISIGGNDLKQFFFAADRENERVRKRYDVLDSGFLNFLRIIIKRAKKAKTPLSFCGEDAGKPLEALCLTAIGINQLSMRSASIGPVKAAIRGNNLDEIAGIIDDIDKKEGGSVREQVKAHSAL